MMFHFGLLSRERIERLQAAIGGDQPLIRIADPEELRLYSIALDPLIERGLPIRNFYYRGSRGLPAIVVGFDTESVARSGHWSELQPEHSDHPIWGVEPDEVEKGFFVPVQEFWEVYLKLRLVVFRALFPEVDDGDAPTTTSRLF